MKKFLQKNWFKMGVLLILVVIVSISTYFYYLSVQSKKIDNNLLKQRDCHIDSTALFYDLGYKDTNSDFTSNYSVKSNRCFALLQSVGDNLISLYLYDVYQDKIYAEYIGRIFHQKESDWAPLSCSIENDFCDSRDEFDNFISKYLDD